MLAFTMCANSNGNKTYMDTKNKKKSWKRESLIPKWKSAVLGNRHEKQGGSSQQTISAKFPTLGLKSWQTKTNKKTLKECEESLKKGQSWD